MKISVSSYSFAGYTNNGRMTQLDCIAKAKEMGFDAIEFTEIDGKDQHEQLENAGKLRAEADKLGFPIIAYTIGASLYKPTEEERIAEVERLKKELDIASVLGAKLLRHDVCYELGKTGAARSFDMMLPCIAKSAREITEYAQTLGIRTCSENHGYIAQDSDRVERLFNAVGHDNYGLLVDMGNFICADEDPALAVSRVAPYAIHVHVKDMLVRNEKVGDCVCPTRGGRYFCGTVVGEGDIPIGRCLDILKFAGYDGYLSIEFEGKGDCIDGIARGLSNLKGMLEKRGM